MEVNERGHIRGFENYELPALTVQIIIHKDEEVKHNPGRHRKFQ